MSLIAYLDSEGRLQDVRPDTPLPTSVAGNVSLKMTDILIPATQFAPTGGRATLASVQVGDTDLLGSTEAEQPTLVNAGSYRVIIVHLAFTTADTYYCRIYGRAVDQNGEPFVPGWAIVLEDTFSSVPANTHERIGIGLYIPEQVYYDQYRIVVARAGAGTADVYAKVVGVK